MNKIQLLHKVNKLAKVSPQSDLMYFFKTELANSIQDKIVKRTALFGKFKINNMTTKEHDGVIN